MDLVQEGVKAVIGDGLPREAAPLARLVFAGVLAEPTEANNPSRLCTFGYQELRARALEAVTEGNLRQLSLVLEEGIPSLY